MSRMEIAEAFGVAVREERKSWALAKKNLVSLWGFIVHT